LIYPGGYPPLANVRGLARVDQGGVIANYFKSKNFFPLNETKPKITRKKQKFSIILNRNKDLKQKFIAVF
jgi:hypothetical protein